jgi:hypothetical protein
MLHRKSLVDHPNFIIATRDSGYKNTASALAEIVDNAIEAAATKIHIFINKIVGAGETDFEIIIMDDGMGMTEEELNLALQFGGSSRFNSRAHLGRYGMGLPNSSLSQCRRVEVTTWKKKSELITNYLDVDEIVEQKLNRLPRIRKTLYSPIPIHSKTGTIVRWSKCDRLSFKYIKSLCKHLHFTLGRIFRYSIWRGVDILVNKEKVIAFDPLFLGDGHNLTGGVPYGKELIYSVRVPNHTIMSEVRVRFVELPLNEWAGWPNEEKRRRYITKCAGVTILRAQREIDYGWFFMGDKRKENYDDWWRCEISFPSNLDEVFGVTHTKQEIKETEFMNSILAPDLEQTAKILNNRVRQKFMYLKTQQPPVFAKQQLERADVYMSSIKKKSQTEIDIKSGDKVLGLKYKIVTKGLPHELFFDVIERNETIILILNRNHLFYDRIFKALHEKRITSTIGFIRILEFVLFAAARAEFAFAGKNANEFLFEFKQKWSSHLNTIIS